MTSGLAHITSTIEADGAYCHPPQSKRTKCLCGETVELKTVMAHPYSTRCRNCGRVHVKEPGPAFRSMRDSGGVLKRPGGRNGCPGVRIERIEK